MSSKAPKTKKDGDKKPTKLGAVKDALAKASGIKTAAKDKKDVKKTEKSSTSAPKPKRLSKDGETTVVERTSSATAKGSETKKSELKPERSLSSVPGNMGSKLRSDKKMATGARSTTKSPTHMPPKGAGAQSKKPASSTAAADSKLKKEPKKDKTNRSETPTLPKGQSSRPGSRAATPSKKIAPVKTTTGGSKDTEESSGKKSTATKSLTKKPGKGDTTSSGRDSKTPTVGKKSLSKKSESPASVNKPRRLSTSEQSTRTPSVASTKKSGVSKGTAPSVASTQSPPPESDLAPEDISHVTEESVALETDAAAAAVVETESADVVEVEASAPSTPSGEIETTPDVTKKEETREPGSQVGGDDEHSIVASEVGSLSRSSSHGPSQPVGVEAAEMESSTMIEARSMPTPPQESGATEEEEESDVNPPTQLIHDSTAIIEESIEETVVEEEDKTKTDETKDIILSGNIEADRQEPNSEVKESSEPPPTLQIDATAENITDTDIKDETKEEDVLETVQSSVPLEEEEISLRKEVIESSTTDIQVLPLETASSEDKEPAAGELEVSRVTFSPSPLNCPTPRTGEATTEAKNEHKVHETLFNQILGNEDFKSKRSVECPSDVEGPAVDSDEMKIAMEDLKGFSELEDESVEAERIKTPSPPPVAPLPTEIPTSVPGIPDNLSFSTSSSGGELSPRAPDSKLSFSSELSEPDESINAVKKYTTDYEPPPPPPPRAQQARVLVLPQAAPPPPEPKPSVEAKSEKFGKFQPLEIGTDLRRVSSTEALSRPFVPEEFTLKSDKNALQATETTVEGKNPAEVSALMPTGAESDDSDDLSLPSDVNVDIYDQEIPEKSKRIAPSTVDATTQPDPIPPATSLEQGEAIKDLIPSDEGKDEKDDRDEVSLTDETMTGIPYSDGDASSLPEEPEFSFTDKGKSITMQPSTRHSLPADQPQLSAERASEDLTFDTGKAFSPLDEPRLSFEAQKTSKKTGISASASEPLLYQDSESSSDAESVPSSFASVGSDVDPGALDPVIDNPTPKPQPKKLQTVVGIGGSGLPAISRDKPRSDTSKKEISGIGSQGVRSLPTERLVTSGITNEIRTKDTTDVLSLKQSPVLPPKEDKISNKDPVDPPNPVKSHPDDPESSTRQRNGDPDEKIKPKRGRRFFVTWAVSVLGVAVTVLLFRKRGV